MEQLFQQLEPEFKGKVAFIAVNAADPREAELCARFNLQYVPTTFFLNAKGEETFNYVGIIKPDDMRARLQALVGEK